MTRIDFLETLRRGLAGLPQADNEDILADYEAHFTEAIRAGRSEDEVASAMGDPSRLAKELRAEAGFRRWEKERSTRNLAGAILALIGLAAVDVVLLLPLLCWLAFFVLVMAIVLGAACIVGLVLVTGFVAWHPFAHIAGSLSRTLFGIGLLAGGIGGGAVLFLILEWFVRLLGKFARLHYRLVSPEDDALSRR
ncbi:MAG: DUF1700 domain-containing protein [Proteobacteria bacterium]|nr:DUF1700 domain-containing protein [Pseudomonadota bacterium]MBI3499014.1 DUF1700 domain-containing protein [Pseudomonadota bacterium]